MASKSTVAHSIKTKAKSSCQHISFIIQLVLDRGSLHISLLEKIMLTTNYYYHCSRFRTSGVMYAISEHIWIWKVFYCLLIVNLANGAGAFSKYSRSNEICSVNNGKRIYLELGDSGVLQATNITVPSFLKIKPTRNETTQTSIQFQCSLDVVTCPSCIIKVSFRSMNFTKNCQLADSIDAMPCKCDYLHLSEPPYEGSGTYICGQLNHYITRTRTLSMKYFYRNSHHNVFQLTYSSERNHEEIIGTSNNSNSVEQKSMITMRSPFFPALYPRDYGTEHAIQCNDGFDKNITNACRIRLIFTDFQIALESTIEFHDSNGEQIDVFTGAIFRPPIIISNGPSLLIRFNANGATGMGYRAIISFIKESQLDEVRIRPDTNCGGHVEMMGGAITMMNMVANDTDSRLYDCVWLIRPPVTYAHLKTHISLRVASFDKLGTKSKLTIKQGMTSDRPDMETIISSQYTVIPAKTFVVPMTSGFYVSLHGDFNAESILALVYTTFSYMNCYVGTEFLCQNHRCIPVSLQCDGFDHCGDNSDEPDSCSKEWSEQDYDRKWYSHTPNYFFPKIERYPDLKTATIIFFASSLGLIVLISALIVLLYKMGTRARNQRELQNHLQTISELLGIDNTSRQEELPAEDPPAYEAPPDYEEVIKVGMEEQMKRKDKERKSNRRRSRSRTNNSSRWTSNNIAHTHLEVILPPETPSSSRALLSSASPSPNPQHYPLPATLADDSIRFDDELIATHLLENSTENQSSGALNREYEKNTLSEDPPSIYAANNGTSVKSSIPDILAERFGKDLIEISSRMLSMQTCSVVCPSMLTETCKPCKPTSQQYLVDERARIRKNWLNFNHDYSDSSSNIFQIKTENADTPQSSYIEDSQCFPVNLNNQPSFDTISSQFLNDNQSPIDLQKTLTSCFSGSLFGNLLDTTNGSIRDHVQGASEEPITKVDNYVHHSHRSLQRSFSMDLIPVTPIKRQSLNKSYGDLLNFQL